MFPLTFNNLFDTILNENRQRDSHRHAWKERQGQKWQSAWMWEDLSFSLITIIEMKPEHTETRTLWARIRWTGQARHENGGRTGMKKKKLSWLEGQRPHTPRFTIWCSCHKYTLEAESRQKAEAAYKPQAAKEHDTEHHCPTAWMPLGWRSLRSIDTYQGGGCRKANAASREVKQGSLLPPERKCCSCTCHM